MAFPPVPAGPFSPATFVGGNGGSPFLSYGWVTGQQAKVATALDVWYSSKNFKGVQLTYADQTRSPVFGSADSTQKTFNFDPDETMTSMTLWGNGVGTRTGRVRFTTSKNKTFDAGKDTTGQTAYPVNVGSGVLVGIDGRSGSEIDMFGALFLRSPIASVDVGNVVYSPSLAGSTSGISPIGINEAYYSNPVDSNQTVSWAFTGSSSRTASTTFTQAAAHMFGESINVEVSATQFGLSLKATSGWQWQTTYTTTTATTVSSTVGFSWSLNGSLDPGENCQVEAIVFCGNASTSYSSSVTVRLEDGTTNTYPERGTLKDVAFTQAMVRILEGDTVKYISHDGVEIDKELLRGFNLPLRLT